MRIGRLPHMQTSSVVIAVVSAAALAVGSVGMAVAQAPHVASHGTASGVVGQDSTSRPRVDRGTLPTLRGRVNDARDLTLSDTTLSPGRYRIVIRDSTTRHNWHLSGNGQDRATSISGTGRSVFKIRLRAGTYTVVCDAHSTTMRFTIQVG